MLSLHSPIDSPIEVLLIEDDDVDASAVAKMLDQVPDVPTQLQRCRDLSSGMERLSSGDSIDVVLLDLTLPESNGLLTLERLCENHTDTAIVVLTGYDDRQLGFTAVQRGAQDYLIKGKVDAELLIRSIGYAIERHRLRSKMSKLMAELKRSNLELEQYAYVVAHDLKAPLRTITSFSDILAEADNSNLSSEEKEFLGFIVSNSQRMTSMIDDLLAYSRVQPEKDSARTIDLSTALNQACENLQTDIEQTGATITHDELPSLPANALQIAQVFQNLIGNAIKFRGDEAPKIQISSAERDVDWEFSVRDNGIGIEPEQRDRVFQVFQQLHGVGEFEGTGIGLAICKKVIEVHGGRIWIESAPDGGTDFHFTLPKQSPTRGIER